MIQLTSTGLVGHERIYRMPLKSAHRLDEQEREQKAERFLTSILGGFRWGFPVNHADGGKPIPVRVYTSSTDPIKINRK